MVSIVFCIDSELGNWHEILDRNDSFVYHAKRFAQESYDTYIVLVGKENDEAEITVSSTQPPLKVLIRQEDVFDKTIDNLKPDVIVRLAGLPQNNHLSGVAPHAFNVLFWAGGDMAQREPWAEHIAVHHPWQIKPVAEANGLEGAVSDIQGGVDVNMFKSDPNLTKERRGYYPANILPPKRQDVAARAFDAIDIPITFTGYEVDSQYATYLKGFANVKVTGRVLHPLVANMFNVSMVAPIMTVAEAGPHVLLEAMSCDTVPIVCSDCPTTSTLLTEGGFKDLIVFPDPEEVALKVEDILAYRLVPKGLRDFVIKNYDLAVKHKRFKEMLRKEVNVEW